MVHGSCPSRPDAGTLPDPPDARDEDAGRLPVALVGLAGIGSAYAQAILRNPRLELCDGYDVVQSNYDAIEALRGTPRAGSFDEFIARTRAAAVVIATPNQFHAPQILAAAAVGKHVFVTKPITNTMDEARACVDACRRAGVVLAVGHSDRREGHNRKLKALLEAAIDEAGDGKNRVTMVQAHMGHSAGLRLSPDQWRFRRDSCPGGSLILLGVHCFDTLHYLFGPIRRVGAFVRRLQTRGEIEDTSVSVLEFESGIVGMVSSSYASPKSTWLKVYGTHHNITCRDGRILVRPLPGTPADEREVPYEKRDAFFDELEDFRQAILTGRSPEVTGADGMRALACVWASLLSHETGRIVCVDDVMSGPASARRRAPARPSLARPS